MTRKQAIKAAALRRNTKNISTSFMTTTKRAGGLKVCLRSSISIHIVAMCQIGTSALQPMTSYARLTSCRKSKKKEDKKARFQPTLTAQLRYNEIRDSRSLAVSKRRCHPSPYRLLTTTWGIFELVFLKAFYIFGFSQKRRHQKSAPLQGAGETNGKLFDCWRGN